MIAKIILNESQFVSEDTQGRKYKMTYRNEERTIIGNKVIVEEEYREDIIKSLNLKEIDIINFNPSERY